MIIFVSVLPGQTERDSLNLLKESYNSKIYLNNFDKQLNTYNFFNHLRYFYTSNNFSIGLRESFNSTITKSAVKSIKDEQYLKLLGEYNLSYLFQAGLFLNNYIYSDDRTLAINRVSNTNASLFLRVNPYNNISITPFGGFSSNNQIGEKNTGFIYGTEANIKRYEIGDVEFNSIVKLQNEDISPRKNTIRLINLEFNSSFEDAVKNTVSAYYAEQRKDFYISADPGTAAEFEIDNNIQSRNELNYFFQDRIKFLPKNLPLSFDITGRASWRNINRETRYVSLKNITGSAFDSKIDEFKLDLLTAAEYSSDNMNISFKFSFAEREEKHLPRKITGLNEIIYNEREESESQKNNNSQLATIALSSLFKVSENDRVTFSIFHRKLKYDTQSETNYDDRDELLSIGRVLYERKFNPFLSAFINLEASLNKIVYIFAERSSNNNIQRIIKFSSGGLINLGKLNSSNSAEVSANYTVYDYEELNPNFRSYSFRQLILRDSTLYKINNRVQLFFTGYIKFSEQGDFKWSNFTSKPSRYLDEKFAEPKIFLNWGQFIFGIGVRYFSLSNFTFVNGVDKNKISDYKSIGPIAEISYDVSDSINFKTYGWYEFISAENNSKREMANFNLRLSYKL